MRAEANMARARSTLTVGGEERMRSSGASTTYTVTIAETTGAILNNVKVVRKQVVRLHGTQNLCVLIIQSAGGGE